MQTLRKFGLEEMALDEPAEALAQLEKFMQQEPDLDTIIAYGELSYLAGKLVEKHDEAAALDYYGASAAHAYVYLFDPTVRLCPQSLRPRLPRCLRSVQRRA